VDVVVTGATGFIGTHLCSALKSQGHNVIEMGRYYTRVKCDRVYHLGGPSTSEYINSNPAGIIDITVDKTREALAICPDALFVYASSKGAEQLTVDNTPQMGYNTAKRLMEIYLQYSGVDHKVYRLPSVYGEGMHNDMFIKRCIDGNATAPSDPDKVHYIGHVNDIVDSLVRLEPMKVEMITLGEIYESFGSGRRGLHRSAPIG